MIRQSRILLALVGATVVLGALVGNASANRLSSSSSTIRAVFNPMTFSGAGFVNVNCPVTLEGSLHSRTIVKTVGSLIGYINRASLALASCTGGTATINQASLPWHVRYAGFTGTLPNITAINTNIVGASFEVRDPGLGVTCNYTTSAASPATGRYNREAGGLLTGVTVGGSIPTSSGFPCPTGTLSGTSSAPTEVGTTTRIRVTLI
jgi:hypothetical protein